MFEIERKFIVSQLPDLQEATSAVIRQGYISQPGDSVSMRLRQADQTFFLTVKRGEGAIRAECEAEITADQFEAFWPLTEGRRVKKTRWTGGLATGDLFELDVFAGSLASLRLVEVEFATEEAAAAFQPPDWFGRDVTESPAFGNKALATYGLPDGIAP